MLSEGLNELAGLGGSLGHLNDKTKWSLKVESPYVKGTHGPQLDATVDSVDFSGKGIKIAFTFQGKQYTVEAGIGGLSHAEVSLDGKVQPNARLVNAGFPGDEHFDFRPIMLDPAQADKLVRLNFRFRA